jgi:hypothetical protein
MSEDLNFEQLLNDLQEKNSQRALNIWIPSLNRGVKFKHLTLNQQKILIKSSIRENLLKLDFSRNIYGIIIENIVEPDVDIELLTVIDMISIGLAFRAADISEDYGFYIDDKFFPVDLNERCELVRTTDYTGIFDPDIIITDGYHVTIQPPTIKVDKEMNDHLYETHKDTPDDPDVLRDMLADVYICEAAKYITRVEIISEGDDPDSPPVTIEFNNFTAEQRLKVINQIPLTVLNKLVTISDKVQDIESKLLDVDLESETASIELNSAFFT